MASSSGPYSTFTCRLYRDGLQTPWGFRLQGGKDFNQPLTVQRVFTGSPAEGELQRGDIIANINGTDVNNLVHTQAQDIIKTSGRQLQLTIQRGQTRYSPQKTQQPSQFTSTTPTGFRSVSFEGSPAQKPFTPPPQGQRPGMNFGVDFTGRVGSPTRRPEQTMINRIQDSLDNIVTQPRQEGEDMNYEYQTVGERRRVFANEPPKPVVRAPGVPGRKGKSWQPPPKTEKPREYGWAPTKRIDPGYVPGPPMHESRSYSPPRQAPSKPRYDPHVEYRGGGSGVDDGSPVWKGSLRAPGSGATQTVPTPRSVHFSSHSPTSQSTRHEQPNYHSRQSPQQQQQQHVQHPASQYTEFNQPQQMNHPQHADGPGGPKVVHLQYNSPMGLYSRENVDETLKGQTQRMGGSAFGDTGKNVDFSKSYVYQMIHEQEAPGGGTRVTETRHHGKQSRSFRALEEEVGASDF